MSCDYTATAIIILMKRAQYLIICRPSLVRTSCRDAVIATAAASASRLCLLLVCPRHDARTIAPPICVPPTILITAKAIERAICVT